MVDKGGEVVYFIGDGFYNTVIEDMINSFFGFLAGYVPSGL